MMTPVGRLARRNERETLVEAVSIVESEANLVAAEAAVKPTGTPTVTPPATLDISPTDNQPIIDKPVVRKPLADKPVVRKPLTDKPAVRKPLGDKPKPKPEPEPKPQPENTEGGEA